MRNHRTIIGSKLSMQYSPSRLSSSESTAEHRASRRARGVDLISTITGTSAEKSTSSASANSGTSSSVPSRRSDARSS